MLLLTLDGSKCVEKSKQCGPERENKGRSFAVLKRMEWDHFTDKMRFEERPGGGEGRGGRSGVRR